MVFVVEEDLQQPKGLPWRGAVLLLFTGCELTVRLLPARLRSAFKVLGVCDKAGGKCEAVVRVFKDSMTVGRVG